MGRDSILRVALLADYREEGWHSMDLVADMLLSALMECEGIHVELIRPEMPAPAQRIIGGRGRNIDRLCGRCLWYPRLAAKRAAQFDVFHVVDHSYSMLVHSLPPGRCIVTCHDIDTFRSVLEPRDNPRPWWFRQMTRRILNGMRKAGAITCVTHDVARQLRDHKIVDPTKISVIPNGVSPEFFAEPCVEDDSWIEQWLQSRWLAGATLLLHVGSVIERKRIDHLLRILAATAKRDPSVHLLRVGGPLNDRQKALARELSVLDRVHELPFLSRQRLAALYRRAPIVLMPSSYEGFGLPVVEACASGAIVLASDLPVFREVGGKAIFFQSNDSASEWAAQVVDLINLRRNDPTAFLAIGRAAKKHASQFSWPAVANQMGQVYQYLANRIGK